MSDGNIEQRLFDELPACPSNVSHPALLKRMPWLNAVSLYQAAQRLAKRGLIDRFVLDGAGCYCRKEGAERPLDARGGARTRRA